MDKKTPESKEYLAKRAILCYYKEKYQHFFMGEAVPNNPNTTLSHAPAPTVEVKIQPKQTPDSIVQATIEQLKDFRNSVNTKTGEELDKNKIQTKLDAINAAIDATTDVVQDAASSARNELREELNLLPNTISALPETVKNTSAEGVNILRNKASSLFEKLKKGARSGWDTIADGTGFALGKVAEGMGHLGEFFMRIMDKIKPHIGKIFDNPLFKNFVGEKNITMVHNFIGYDPESALIEEEINTRLPEKIIIRITTKKEKTLFKDLYDEMLRKQNKTPESYPRGSFIKSVIDELGAERLKNIPDENKDEIQDLNMAVFSQAAEELIKKTPVAPVVAPVPAATTTTPPPPAA